MFTFVNNTVQYYIFTQILSLDKNVIIGIRTIQDFLNILIQNTKVNL